MRGLFAFADSIEKRSRKISVPRNLKIKIELR